ncbi:MAG: transcriptional repressor [Thermotogae bacterium]|nr:transcriptional repressor [Thermotogota bacterium]HOO75488.1 Fur family transcriptional regulator [Tepiditoga sp.]
MIKTLNRDEVVMILKKSSVRITPNRLLVAEIIFNSKNHPSIDEIHTDIIRSGRNISFTSVYNIIKMFQTAGIVKEIKSKDRSRYDGNISTHSHFICKNCGRVFDIDDDFICTSPERVMGMLVENVELTYYGICSECEEIKE